MKDTATRINEALEQINIGNFNPDPASSKDVQRLAKYASNYTSLKGQFRNIKFVYGTTGPNALNKNNFQNNGGSSAIVRAVNKIRLRARKNNLKRIYNRQNFESIPAFIRKKALESLVANTYDPGPRVAELIKNGGQMMDMYYGVHGNHSNHIWQDRNVIIAEFLHHAMQFHFAHKTWEEKKKPHGKWVHPERPFNPDKPGWLAFREAFPHAADPGWKHQPATTEVYGQSATKEMSKIIRECIKMFGGTIVFDIKGVFGHNLFGLENRYMGDTDLELEDILNSFRGRITSSTIPFGQGQVQFQWGSRPVVPTRAHFLVNWNFNRRFGGGTMNTMFNRNGEPGSGIYWIDYLEAVMSDEQVNGLPPNWYKLNDFPPEIAAGPHGQGKAAAIEALADVLTGPPGIR